MAYQREKLRDLITALHPCDFCRSPMVIGSHVIEEGTDEEDEDSDACLECSACGNRWYSPHDARWNQILGLTRVAFAENGHGAARAVVSHVLKEHELARDAFEGAGRELPRWLLRARPAWGLTPNR